MREDSLGHLLRSYGLRVDDLKRALDYQSANPKLLLGNICVSLGFVSVEVLNAALKRQAAMRKPKAVTAFVNLATERTKQLNDSISGLAGALERVNGSHH